ncbi:MAG: hypothetical protein Q8K82_11595 [Gemmatimonadaceae bacterium]|nr:hypothetical protein [Gemmatimonadaceae bacterium]
MTPRRASISTNASMLNYATRLRRRSLIRGCDTPSSLAARSCHAFWRNIGMLARLSKLPVEVLVPVALFAAGCGAGDSIAPPRVAPPRAAPASAVETASAASPGVIVLIGGGSEGNIGQKGAWSYALYKEVVANGDVTGDGVVTIAVLSPYDESHFIPNYFAWIGRTLGIAVAASNV